MKKVLVSVPLDYIVGYLRYGHVEKVLDLSDEEYSQFELDPGAFMQNHEKYLRGSKVIVDDYSVEDCGNYEFYDTNYELI